jgi:hypothetical protein
MDQQAAAYTPRDYPIPQPHKTLEEITQEINQISQELTNMLQLEPVPLTIDGRAAKFKFKRRVGGYTIGIGLKSLMITKHMFITRLIHELVHIYHDQNFLQDNCGNGVYHTEPFSKQMDNWGCVTTWGRANGYAQTTALKQALVDELAANGSTLVEGLDDLMVEEDSPISFTNAKTTSSGKRSAGFVAKIYDIECPHCQQLLYIQRDRLTTEAAFNAQQGVPEVTTAVVRTTEDEDEEHQMSRDYPEDDSYDLADAEAMLA